MILLDLMMPVMDGWQFRKEQKQDADIAGIPLVVITATGKRPVLIDAAELVMKPLDLTPPVRGDRALLRLTAAAPASATAGSHPADELPVVVLCARGRSGGSR